jgi:hypothetical protein
MREKLFLAVLATSFVSFRVLAVANFQPQTALGIAQSQGVTATVLGTIVPILPRLVPLLTVYLAAGATVMAAIPLAKGDPKAHEPSPLPFYTLGAAIILFGVSLIISDAAGRNILELSWQGLQFAIVQEWAALVLVLVGFAAFALRRAYRQLKAGGVIAERKVQVERKTAFKALWRAVLSAAWTILVRLVQVLYLKAPETQERSNDAKSAADLQGDPPKSDSAEPANRKAGRKGYKVGSIFRTLVAAFLLFAALGFPDARKVTVHPAQVARSMWVPEEALGVKDSSGKTSIAVGYVLQVDSDWSTLLLADSRLIAYIPTPSVLSRTQCRGRDQENADETGLPMWHAAGVIKTFLPSCDSIRPPS